MLGQYGGLGLDCIAYPGQDLFRPGIAVVLALVLHVENFNRYLVIHR